MYIVYYLAIMSINPLTNDWSSINIASKRSRNYLFIFVSFCYLSNRYVDGVVQKTFLTKVILINEEKFWILIHSFNQNFFAYFKFVPPLLEGKKKKGASKGFLFLFICLFLSLSPLSSLEHYLCPKSGVSILSSLFKNNEIFF